MISSSTAAPPETAIAATSSSTIMPTRARPVSGPGSPIRLSRNSVAKVPIMKISECAKLISRSTP